MLHWGPVVYNDSPYLNPHTSGVSVPFYWLELSYISTQIRDLCRSLHLRVCSGGTKSQRTSVALNSHSRLYSYLASPLSYIQKFLITFVLGKIIFFGFIDTMFSWLSSCNFGLSTSYLSSTSGALHYTLFPLLTLHGLIICSVSWTTIFKNYEYTLSSFILHSLSALKPSSQ